MHTVAMGESSMNLTVSSRRLRSVTGDDRDFLYQCLKDSRITDRIPEWGYRTSTDVAGREWVDTRLHPNRHEVWIDRLIVDDHSAGILGSISLSLATGSLSYWIVPDQQGCGHATFAVRTLLDDVFSHRLISTIWAEVERDNLASQRVLLRTGFSFTGLDRRRVGNKPITLSRFERRAQQGHANISDGNV